MISGLASIKPQFLSKDNFKCFDTKFLVKSDNMSTAQHKNEDKTEDNGSVCEDGIQSTHKKPKNKFRGQNKRRRNEMKKYSDQMKFNNQINGKKLCLNYISDNECNYGLNCNHSHELEEYLKLGLRPEDICKECHVFDTFGKCPFGITCRFGSKHLVDGFKNLINSEKVNKMWEQKSSKNLLSKELQLSLRKKKYDFSQTKPVLDSLKTHDQNNYVTLKSQSFKIEDNQRVDFSGKLYLAPLTTVGNLPFRRVCKRLGADITCGEMALATNLLEGSQSEWALLRRHPSEDIFG